MTHANEKWTEFKYNCLGLDRFVPWERVNIVSEDKFKGPEDWRGAIEKLNVFPQEVLIAGDNLRGDIMAAAETGVKHLVYFKHSKSWSVYSEGEVPEGTVVVTRGFGKMIEELLRS